MTSNREKPPLPVRRPSHRARRAFLQAGLGGIAALASAGLVGCGSGDDLTGTAVGAIKPHGTKDQLAELQTRIDEAGAAWDADPERRKRLVRIGPGVLRVSAAPHLKSGVVIEGAGAGVTIIKPHASWCPTIDQVDDRSNSLIAGEGVVDTAKMDTTLTTAITPGGVAWFGAGARELSVASLGGLAAGDYFAVEGHETGEGQQPGGSNGSNVVCCELLQAAQTLTSPDRIGLSWPTKQHHVTTNGGLGQPLSVRAVSPLRECEIRGITLDGGGCLMAVGLRLDRAMDVSIRGCSFVRFTRNALEAFGCSNLALDDLRIDGECNGGLYLDSAIDCHISSFSTSPDGARHHASGVIRSAIRFRGCSTACSVNDFTIRHMCSGIKLECFRDISVTNGTIDDIDIRPKMAIDSEEHVGIAIDMGATNINDASWSGPLTLANVLVTNCRADPAQAVIGGVAQTYCVWLHDVQGINASNLSVENTGVSAYTTLDGDDDYWMPGVGAQDCAGVLVGLRVKGCEYAFAYFSSLGLKVTDFEILIGPGGGGTNPVIGLWFNQNLAAPCEFVEGNIQGGIYFGPDFVPDYEGLTMENISFDGRRFDGPLMLAKNTSGGARRQGDVGVFDPDAPPGTREVDLAEGGGEPGACIVAMPLINSVADGGMMVVAPANTNVDAIKVIGEVKVGDLLVTTPASTAAGVDNEAAAYTAIGRALTSKGAGVGFVKMGPA